MWYTIYNVEKMYYTYFIKGGRFLWLKKGVVQGLYSFF